MAGLLYVVFIVFSCNSSSPEEMLISADWQLNSKQLVVPTCSGWVKKNGGLFSANLDNDLGDALGMLDTNEVNTTFEIHRNGDFIISKNNITKIKGHWTLTNDSLLSVKDQNVYLVTFKWPNIR